MAWYIGGLLWIGGRTIGDIVPWLAAFLILTIAGERLELARVAFLGKRAADGLVAAAALRSPCAAVSVWWAGPGWRLTGLGMVALAAWLALHDVARRTVRGTGLPRFAAACLLAGYAWPAVAGAIWLAAGRPASTGFYDAALHAVFLGFVISMVFGHAPVILPAVLRVRLPYHPILYAPLALLHASLLVRVVGDLATSRSRGRSVAYSARWRSCSSAPAPSQHPVWSEGDGHDVHRCAPEGGPAPAPRRSRSVWHAVANGVVLVWLALTVVAAFVRHELPVPQWLLIHLFLLGAVTNAIVTWTEHFASALLRVPAPPDWWPITRLVVLNAGIVAVLCGVSEGFPWVAVGGAAGVVGVVAAHIAVLGLRGRSALGGRFAHVVAWYLWAGAALITGGTLGGLMASGHVPSGWHERLHAAHAQVNLLGWVGLAVLGTLFTLWPTVLRTRMVDGVGRIARWSLRFAVPGLAVAVGGLLADLRWVVVAGLLVYAGPPPRWPPFPSCGRCASVARTRRLSWMLAAGTSWFAVALLVDASRQSLSGLLPLMLVGFVGQTLLGALTFLLPVVLGGDRPH